MMNITSLSPGDLCHVIRFLRGHDIARLSQTCQYLRQVCNIDTVWRHACIEEYNFSSLNNWDGTYKDVYCQFLRKFGGIYGLWQADFYPYGGLVIIKDDVGKVSAYEVCIKGNDITKDLEFKKIFSVTLVAGKLRTNCALAGDCTNVHEGELVPVTVPDRMVFGKECSTLKGISFKCMNGGSHQATPSNVTHYDGIDNVEQWKTRAFQSRHQRPLIFTRFTPCQGNPNQGPLISGLYKGDYNVHGVEIVHVKYTQEDVLSGVKITGDPNVPATKTSFVAHLTRTREGMDKDAYSQYMEYFDIEESDDEDDQEQVPTGMKRFRLPLSFEEDDSIPKYCKSMYWADGQVALPGFISPDFIAALLVIFNETQFGIIFLELNTFAQFTKVKDSELNPSC